MLLLQLLTLAAVLVGGQPQRDAAPLPALAPPVVSPVVPALASPQPQPQSQTQAEPQAPNATTPPPTTTSVPEPAQPTTVKPTALVEEECVHLPANLCPPPGELCRCRLTSNGTSAICCDISALVQLKEGLNCQGLAGAPITSLHARNITLNFLDVSVLSLPQLNELAITDGHISELKGSLEAKDLACLNLSANSLVDLGEDTFKPLHSLRNLDLSGNDLQQLVNLNSDVHQFKLDISGNNKLSCLSITELMKHMRNSTDLQFSHDNNTYCLTPKSFHWFNSTAKVPLSSVLLLTKLEQECPRGEGGPCDCRTAGLDMVPGKPPTYSVSVDCSGRRLTELPSTLPQNTVSLNVTSNNISDLTLLGTSLAYTSIRMFYADNNKITSISVLEGSRFIDKFLSLRLRSNNISSLPTYILSNVFYRNWDDRTVHLGLNHLKCDCSTAQTVKMWLMANSKHIPDYDEVLCENMREKVFELDKNKVCTVQSDWTDYVYYLVAAEVLLLVLLISKISYDYWVFKTAGYLPWPASKMPKLPCDWVFES